MASASMSRVGKRPRGGERIIAAGADGHDAVFRLQHVAGAGEQQADILVGDEHHRLEPAQVPVGAPVLGELDAGAGELAGILLELRLEALEQGEGIGRRAGEAADHLALGEAADFAGVALHHGLAEAHLPVAADDDAAALADHEDRGGMHAGGGVFGHGRRTPAGGKIGALRAVSRPDLIIHRAKATRVAFLVAAC